MKTLLTIALIVMLVSGCGDSLQVGENLPINFPDSISARATSPDSALEARIYYWRDENANFLAAERWCLGFSKGKTTWFIERELGEGKGSYEGGVFYPEWLSNYEVKVHRRIDDQDADVVFDLNKQAFVLAK
jgi:hypothetical protein